MTLARSRYPFVLGALLFLLPVMAYAALVNINTADAALLDTLPGIGPSKAAAIVDYRTQHGLFARIEDIQNVSGIGASTYAGIAPFITVGDTGTASTQATSTTGTSTPAASGSASAYVPPPSAIALETNGPQTALLDVPVLFSAQATSKSGANDAAAHIVWSFGDGSSEEGSTVEKTYRYAGTYLVVVTATDGTARARSDLTITVKPATARIAAVSGEGITLANDAGDRLDLSGWRLLADVGSFRIPEGMAILPNASVLLPYVITNLPVSTTVALLYPDGLVAARYAPPAAVIADATTLDEQPSSLSSGYSPVQQVESIISPPNVQLHEEGVSAPATTTELAAAGAAFASAPTAPATSRIGNLVRSPWTLGLIGVVTLAASAFIFL